MKGPVMSKTLVLIFALAIPQLSIASPVVEAKLDGTDYLAMLLTELTTRDLSAAEREKMNVSNSSTFQMMKGALSAAADASPTLGDRLRRNEITSYSEDPFRSVHTSSYNLKSSEADARFLAKGVLAVFDKLLDGCEKSKSTDKTEYVLSKSAGCENGAVSDLNHLGLNRVIRATSGDGSFSYVLAAKGSLLRDMSLVRDKLALIPELSEIASEFDIGFSGYSVAENFKRDDLGGAGGPTEVLEFLGKSGTESEPTLSFRYWLGSGDCVMGCGQIHTWTVTVSSQNTTSSDGMTSTLFSPEITEQDE
jgi:hypothetical protein